MIPKNFFSKLKSSIFTNPNNSLMNSGSKRFFSQKPNFSNLKNQFSKKYDTFRSNMNQGSKRYFSRNIRDGWRRYLHIGRVN